MVSSISYGFMYDKKSWSKISNYFICNEQIEANIEKYTKQGNEIMRGEF